MKISTTSKIVSLFTVAALAFIPLSTSAAAPKIETVRFALPVAVPDGGQVWAYVPQWADMFKSERVKVEIIFNNGGGAALTQVATGKADFAINNPQALINAVGQGLPVVGIATVIPRQIYGIYVLPGSPIKTYADLKGKKIGISAPTSGVYPFSQAAFAEKGLDWKTDITYVTTGSGAPQLVALTKGTIDAVATQETSIASFATQGTTVRALAPTSVQDDPADLIVANKDFVKNNRDLTIRFARAVMRGIVYANLNPDKALDAFQYEYPQSAVGLSDAETLSIIKSRIASTSKAVTQKSWGDIPLDGYKRVMDLGVKYGAITTAQDFTKVFDTSLLADIQDFDIRTPNIVAGGSAPAVAKPAAPAATTVKSAVKKSGDACTKVGATAKTSAGKTLKCQKVGGKLILR